MKKGYPVCTSACENSNTCSCPSNASVPGSFFIPDPLCSCEESNSSYTCKSYGKLKTKI